MRETIQKFWLPLTVAWTTLVVTVLFSTYKLDERSEARTNAMGARLVQQIVLAEDSIKGLALAVSSLEGRLHVVESRVSPEDHDSLIRMETNLDNLVQRIEKLHPQGK